MKAGINLDMMGNNNIHHLQFSKLGNTLLDKVATDVLKKRKAKYSSGPFLDKVINDEKVFDGPGIDIPMISLSRFPYPEYHTSADNIDIISIKKLKDSKAAVLEVINTYDKKFDINNKNYIPKRTYKGLLFLSGYGLWVDWQKDFELNNNIEKILLNLEGDKSIYEIAELLGMDFYTVLNFIDKLLKKGLVKKIK